MKKRLFKGLRIILVLAAILLILQRIIPVELKTLMPGDFVPESCGLFHMDGTGSVVNTDLTEEETEQLWELLGSLKYRYNGRVPGGVMKGQMYHVSLFWQEPVELVDLFITTKLGVVYLNDRKYEMLGDTAALLDFLGQWK